MASRSATTTRPLRGHSIEFRINAEDPARNFLPAPGTITEWNPPSGPGVRLDAGYGAGQTVPQAFDSLIGKLVVTGASRKQALERSRRALAEFTIGGMPTVLPFHRAVVDDPAFAGDSFGVHTRWIETEFSAALEPQPAAAAEPEARPGAADGRGRRKADRGGGAGDARACRPRRPRGPGRAVQGFARCRPRRPRAAPRALAATPWSRPCRARS